MIKDEIDEIVERQQAQHHGRPNERQLKMKKIRNWLNIAFMVIAMAGVMEAFMEKRRKERAQNEYMGA